MRDIGPFQATLKQVQTVAPDASRKNRDYAVNCANFAKVKYLGGGWWRIHGYHYNGSDAKDIYNIIQMAKPCKID